MKELTVFDELKSQITSFVVPVHKLKVMDFKSSAVAVEHGRTLQGLLKEIESRRDALVRPRNEEVKRVNEYVKEIKAPLEQAKRHLDAEVGAFAAEQRRIKEEEDRKIELERQAEEQRIADEAQAKREALEAEAAEASRTHDPTFGNIEDQQEELARQQELIDQEEAQAIRVAQAAASVKSYDAGRQTVKGVRMVWDCELVDIDQVPVEYLKRELNTQMVTAAARGSDGKINIPGVRIFQKPSVGFGQNTYVPKEAITAERARARLAPPSEPVRHGRRIAAAPAKPSRRPIDRERKTGRR